MDMQHIKPSTMSTFHATLYSPSRLFMSFIDRHILMLTIAICYICNSLSTKDTEKSYRNELQLQKLYSNMW